MELRAKKNLQTKTQSAHNTEAIPTKESENEKTVDIKRKQIISYDKINIQKRDKKAGIVVLNSSCGMSQKNKSKYHWIRSENTRSVVLLSWRATAL